ncbi:hypothetical protein QFZ53_001234 [Microbacterium natoriense]|uniref:SGNH hydrolase-type esterase domain-containing protein n=1 Tax=Microbacterium natoriense TaxID=284570 RepID=A0AAW8EU79_9MICO|nr:SGNH/GDSL hydrolase family protein [Microbacterium natoriense]MDQ0647038.1 hypothetical protein [Microbacterium natoriense]
MSWLDADSDVRQCTRILDAFIPPTRRLSDAGGSAANTGRISERFSNISGTSATFANSGATLPKQTGNDSGEAQPDARGERTKSVIVSGVEWEALVHGAASLEAHTAGGVEAHRVPAWARAQFEDPLFSLAEACPAGVIVRFETDSSFVTLTAAATTAALVGTEPTPVTLAVRQDGTEILAPLSAPSVIFFGADTQIVETQLREPETIDISTAGNGPVEIFLPHNARIRLISLQATENITPAQAQGIRWTHYGSSISHGMNALTATRTWPVAAAIRLGWNLQNLSYAGNAQLDGFMARMIRDSPADLITLKVGINLINSDSMRERTFRPAVHAFLDTIREGQPTTPIVLITAVACPIHEDSPGPVTRDPEGMARAANRTVERDTGALTLSRTREILEQVTVSRDDDRLHLLDGRELFGIDDVDMLYDRLHPDQNGLDLIAQRFADKACTLAEEWGSTLTTPAPNSERPA